jgi:hypothetical protein
MFSNISYNFLLPQILVSALVAASYAEADADALYYGAYGAYGGAALGYPYAYARGYATPAVRTVAAAPIIAAPAVRTLAAVPTIHTIAAAPAVRTVAAAPIITKAAPIITKAAPLIAAPSAAVPTVTSSQFHSQDENKNYAFGYSNINSARQESGNALTGVTGSYSDGFRTYNYVADGFGFRHV